MRTRGQTSGPGRGAKAEAVREHADGSTGTNLARAFLHELARAAEADPQRPWLSLFGAWSVERGLSADLAQAVRREVLRLRVFHAAGLAREDRQ